MPLDWTSIEMEFSAWLLFCAVSAASAFSPGPALLLAIANATSLGSRKALVSSAGNIFGLFLMSCAAMAGLGAVLKTSPWLFAALKIFGAAYLIYLGLRQWRTKVSFFATQPQSMIAKKRTDVQLFRQGFLIAITNPKSILYFTALFPQFINPAAEKIGQFFLLTITFLCCVICAHLSYVLGARAMKIVLSNSLRIKIFNRLFGCVFIVLGLSILLLKIQAR
jgi:threonine/homoserine/homoserine lactone efflux protein